MESASILPATSVKRQALTQNPLRQTKLTALVGGVTGPVGVGRIRPSESSAVKWLCNWSNNHRQRRMINESVSALRAVSSHLL